MLPQGSTRFPSGGYLGFPAMFINQSILFSLKQKKIFLWFSKCPYEMRSISGLSTLTEQFPGQCDKNLIPLTLWYVLVSGKAF